MDKSTTQKPTLADIAHWWDYVATDAEQERVGIAAGYTYAELWRAAWFLGAWYGNPQLKNGLKPQRIPRHIRLALQPHVEAEMMRNESETL